MFKGKLKTMLEELFTRVATRTGMTHGDVRL